MKQRILVSNKIFNIVRRLSVLVGTFVGIIIALKYERIGIGLLGASSLWLIYLLFFPPKNFVRTQFTPEIDLVEYSKEIYADFLLSIVVFLAGYNLLTSLIYYIQLMLH